MGSGFLIVVVLIFAVMYFLMVRPQKRQQQAHQEMLNNLKIGDEVITAGGIYGDIVGVEPDRVSLEIAEDVEIEVSRRAIASIVQPEDPASSGEEEIDAVGETEEADAAERQDAEEPEPEEARR